jgi:hypothetical protein
MAERVPFPVLVGSDAYSETDLTWAEDPGANGVTKPASGRFEDGYYEGTGANDGSIVPAEEHNSLFSWWMKLFAWVVGFIPREWAEVSEAITATASPEMFIVHAPAAGLRARHGAAYSVQGPAGASAVQGMACDGEQLYIGQNSTTIYNLDPTDGAPPSTGNWSAAVGDTIDVIAADGLAVYAGIQNYGGIAWINRTTGALTKRTGHGATDITLIAANGEYVVCVSDTDTTFLHFYQQDGTYDGSWEANDVILAVCISGPFAYVFDFNTSTNEYTVSAVALSTRTAAWTKTNTAVPDITAAVMATDGRRLYVGHTITTIDSVQRTVTAFDMFDGTEIWARDNTTALDDGIHVDDQELYISDGTNTVVLDKAAGHPIAQEFALPAVYCGDGISVFGIDTNNTERFWTGRPSMEFQRCIGSDGDRAPWPGMLAIPTGRNL